MISVLLENAENARWRLASALAARYGRTHDPVGGVVDDDPLPAQRDDGHDRFAARARRSGYRRDAFLRGAGRLGMTALQGTCRLGMTALPGARRLGMAARRRGGEYCQGQTYSCQPCRRQPA